MRAISVYCNAIRLKVSLAMEVERMKNDTIYKRLANPVILPVDYLVKVCV